MYIGRARLCVCLFLAACLSGMVVPYLDLSLDDAVDGKDATAFLRSAAEQD